MELYIFFMLQCFELGEFEVFGTVDHRNIITVHLDESDRSSISLFTHSRGTDGLLAQSVHLKGLYPAENFGRS